MADEMNCNNCGQRLVPEPPGVSRQPCPACGSTNRNFHKSIESSIKPSGKMAATTLRDEQPIGFTESHDPSLTRFAGLDPNGTVRLRLLGLAPRNEQDSDVVCKTLVSALAALGQQVELKGPGEQDEDFILIVNGDRIGVQVVRALTCPHFWTQLARKGEVSELNLTIVEAVEALKIAIEHKTIIPPAQRSNLILLLDAYRLPALVLGPVTNEFKNTQATWAQSLGFYAVYVVGPKAVFVSRLDESHTT